MDSSLIFWLDSTPDLPSLGGKARLLARLAAAGLPVPPGFVLSAEVLPADPPGGDLADLKVPAAAAAALSAAYAELGRQLGEENPLVAVRSSGLAEDLQEASFAGQYATVLGVRGEEELLAAAARCWASLWSPGVAAYRAAVEKRLGKALPAPGMAVLVQALIPAEAAGVAETMDVAGGDDEVVMVHGSWGLGRSVVDGAVEADSWRVERASSAVLELRVGNKLTRAGLGLEAQPEPLDESLRRRPCLALEQASAVARLALAAEAIVGRPADVEWALAGDKLWLVQARPLVRPIETEEQPAGPSGPTPAFPFAWPDPEMAKLYWRREADDARVFEVLKPFELDARKLNMESMKEADEITGAPETNRCLEVNGYLYYAHLPSPIPAEERAARAEAYGRPLRALHDRGETLFSSAILPEAQANTARLAAVDPDTLSPAELADHFEAVLDWYKRAWVLHMSMDPWDDDCPVGRAGLLFCRLTGTENRWAVLAPFSHLPQKEHEAVDQLIELARLVQETPPLLALFQDGEPGQVLRDLETVEGGAAFRRGLDVLLEEFGLQCGASQGVMGAQVMPGWREEPALVIATVQRYLPRDLDALVRVRRRSAERYAGAVQQIKAQVAEAGATPEQQAQFDFWFAAMENQVRCVVDHNYYLDSPMNALLHQALLACGHKLAAAGAIEEAEDVWWLRARQVAAAVRSLELPGPPAWRRLVAAQKALYAWQRSLTPPAYLGTRPPAQPAAPGKEEALPANLLVKGIGAAPGVATGRVRMVDSLALVPEVRPGDVFVAHDCGVLWAWLLPVATAVVLDVSNPGEHPMRVCLEFGIPGIVRAGNATQVLREGQRVTVDGSKGWVLAAEE